MGQTSFAVAFLGGIASLVSPCAALLLPGFFAFAFSRTGTLVGRIALFCLGLLATMLPLGLAVGGLGLATTGPRLLRVGAVLLVVLGLVTASGWSPRLPGPTRRPRDPASPLAVLVLGATYGLASGCTGPILGSVLTVAAMGGDPLLGAALMGAYALGMTLPLLVLCLAWQPLRLRERGWLRPRPVRIGPLRTTLSQVVTGLVFVLLGGWLLATGGAGAAVLDAERQFRLEQWLAAWGRRVGDLPLALLVLALAGGLTWLWLAERDRLAAQRRDPTR